MDLDKKNYMEMKSRPIHWNSLQIRFDILVTLRAKNPTNFCNTKTIKNKWNKKPKNRLKMMRTVVSDVAVHLNWWLAVMPMDILFRKKNIDKISCPDCKKIYVQRAKYQNRWKILHFIYVIKILLKQFIFDDGNSESWPF